MFEELHRSKSSLPPYETLSKPTLVRWNLGEPLTVANCVVMSPKDVSIILFSGFNAYVDHRQPNMRTGSEMVNLRRSCGVRKSLARFRDGERKQKNG